MFFGVFFVSIFTDFIISTGGAFLFSDYIQIDAGLSFNTKSTPGMFYFNTGVSYRLDYHKAFISGEEIKAKETAKEEKELKKTLRKSTKKEKKRIAASFFNFLLCNISLVWQV